LKSAGPAWTTATFADDGYLWFTLRDSDVLRSTILWIENHGRHGKPWSGRNNCLAWKDVTAYFADGPGRVDQGQQTDGRRRTDRDRVHADRPTAVNYIQGTAQDPGRL